MLAKGIYIYLFYIFGEIELHKCAFFHFSLTRLLSLVW